MTVVNMFPPIRYVTDQNGTKTDVLVPLATWEALQHSFIAPQLQSLVVSDKDILGGRPIFIGTRVPVKTLLDYLEAGHTLEDFLDDFPTVTSEQAQGLLTSLKQILLELPHASIAR